MRVSIIEPNFAGHSFVYVRHVVKALDQLGADVTFHCTEDGASSAEFRNHLGNLVVNIDTSLADLGQGRAKVYRNIVESLRRVNATSRPDAVVYPTADFAAVAAGLGRLIGKNPLSARHNFCMLTKLGFAYPGTEPRVINLIEQGGLSLSKWDEIGVIDSVAFRRLKMMNSSLTDRMRLLPDPISISAEISDKQSCREQLGWDKNSFVFLCPGVIRPGKGIPELIQGFKELNPNSTVHLIVAGPVRQGVKTILAEPSVKTLIKLGKIVVYDTSLSESQLGVLIVASDVVCCLYPKQNHPSSITVTSLAYNRPVLYSDSLWLGDFGSQFEIGFGCNPMNILSVASAMRTAMESCSRWTASPMTTRLLKYQSAENFRQHWTDIFIKAQGNACDPCALMWDDVVYEDEDRQREFGYSDA